MFYCTVSEVPLNLILMDTYITLGNDIDRLLNETVTDKIRKYTSDHYNNTPNVITFMTTITSTSGRLHSEFVRLLFLQTHRETDRFCSTSTTLRPYDVLLTPSI